MLVFVPTQVHAPIFDPGTVLQLALFKETGPRTSRRTQMVGLLRLRLSSLATDTLHSARLPLCASRRSGGERSATVDLCIKARPDLDAFDANMLQSLRVSVERCWMWSALL